MSSLEGYNLMVICMTIIALCFSRSGYPKLIDLALGMVCGLLLLTSVFFLMEVFK